ncbi:hypothetical protein Leryth_022411 [Lithospermum erythrorhizon]|nr:hypothetical protein Leryth_022411 [Lithospermum erythrorhizon]
MEISAFMLVDCVLNGLATTPLMKGYEVSVALYEPLDDEFEVVKVCPKIRNGQCLAGERFYP